MANVTKKPQNNSYKKGKLSKNARFSPRRIKWTPIIVLLCVLLTFIFAMLLGNILGKRVEHSQNEPTSTQGASNLTPPSPDKVNPKDELLAFLVDFANATPENSLSEVTGDARNKGNALFISIKNENNEIIYSSDKTTELDLEHKENLTLSRLTNHLEYYNDFALGFFKSEFSANLDEESALKLQTNEILLLKEATDTAFDQIIIEFEGAITKNNLIYYQTYLLNLKLACPNAPVGVLLSLGFLNNSDNAGSVAGLLGIVDFFVLDFEKTETNEIKSALTSIVYFTSRYNCTVFLSGENETILSEQINALKDKGIENFIVK